MESRQKKRIHFNLSFLTFALVVSGVVIASLYSFYDATIRDKIITLNTVVKSHALLIEEIYRAIGNQEETLETLKRAHHRMASYKSDGEFQLGYKEDGHIHLLTWTTKSSEVLEKNINIDEHPNCPMNQAISGKTGTFIGKDFHGGKIIASFTYIEPFQMGFVGSIPLWNLQKLFLVLAAKLFAIGGILTFAGILLFKYFENKKNRRDAHHKQELEVVNQNLNAFKQGMDTHSMLCMTDSNGVIIEANNRICETTGYSKDELIGQTFAIFKSGEHNNEFYRDLWSTIKSGRVWNGEIKNKCKNGDTFWVETTITPVKLVNSLTENYICIQTEITEQKEHEKQLIQDKTQAQSASERKSDFLTHMSHEIRTPLSSIIGFTELVEKDKTLNIKTQKYLQTIKRNSQHLMSLVGEILDFSKIEADQLEIKKISTSLLSEIEKVKALFKNRDKNINFSIEYVPPVPEIIHTDPLRFRQILINLVGNAFKYTDKGFIKVRIRMSNSNLGELHDKLAIEIQDTGIGISAECYSEIFKPFKQTHDFHVREKGGTGLGLPLSKELAQLLGGDVLLLQTTPGKGSTFVMYIDFGGSESVQFLTKLPISSKNKNKNKDKDKDNTSLDLDHVNLQGMHILLIEDSSDISELVRINLEREGARVAIASNGEDGLEKLKTLPFDLVLLDIQLPRISGHELIGFIRKLKPKIPVVALTAHSTRAEKEACLEGGFNDFLAKPINFEKLIETLYKWNYWGKTIENSDPNILRPLYSAFSDDLHIRNLLRNFVLTMPDKIDTFQKSVDTSDWKGLKEYCHKMKGDFGTYGYPEMQELAAKIETICIGEFSEKLKHDQIKEYLSQMELLVNRAQIVFQ